MLITPQKKQVSWNKKNRNWYEQKGYTFTKTNDPFVVNVEDLSEGCDKKINISCDYCGCILLKRYCDYVKIMKGVIPKIACRKCRGQKTKESNLIQYGVENISQLEETKEKKEKTSLKNYGTKYPNQNPEQFRKMNETISKKYGVNNVSKLKEVKEKKKRKSQEKFGTNTPLQSSEIIKKIEQTLFEKFGVRHNMMVPEIREKAMNTIEEKYGAKNPFQSDMVKSKIKQSMLKKYGFEYYSQTPDYINQVKQTSQKRYGVDHYSQTKQWKEKVSSTNLKKYGGISPISSEVIKNKMKLTTKNKYGKEYYSQTEDCKEKIKETSKKKYGVEHPLQSPIIREKIINTLSKNGNVYTSKQQIHLHTILGGELNYPIGIFPVDIAFLNEFIYVEYDGGGHDLCVKIGNMTQAEFTNKTIMRYNYLKRRGWKEIRIISPNDFLPEDEKIINLVDKAKKLLSEGHNWIEIFLEDEKIFYKNKERELNKSD